MAGILSIQINSVLKNKNINFEKIKNFIESNVYKKLDLIVIPEFFATNNAYMDYTEPEDGGESAEFISLLAKKYNTNIIAGSIVRRKNDKLYNSSFAFDRKGSVVQIYDKIHLYNYFGGSEGTRITAGNDISAVDFDFARVGFAICFDVRFPLHFINLIKKQVDIIVLPAAWLIPNSIYNSAGQLKKVQDIWISMCRTRGCDNEVYFVVSNQTGAAANNLSGIGQSMIISPLGEILQNAGDKEGAIYSDIDMNVLKSVREVFPAADLS